MNIVVEEPTDNAEHSAPINVQPVAPYDLVERLLGSERYDDGQRKLLAKLADLLGIDESGNRSPAARDALAGVMAECHNEGLGTAARMLMSIRSSDVA